MSTSAVNVFAGICVEENKIQLYLDHGERQLPVTPVSTGTVTNSAPAPTCAQGNYEN
jgi:hypothetical protein